jgi:hypothetical protein
MEIAARIEIVVAGERTCGGKGNAFVFHGQLLISQLVHARARRRFQRGLKSKPMRLIKKLRNAKKSAGPHEKPPMVKTHLRDMIIVPEMIGSVVGVYVSFIRHHAASNR